MIETKTRVGRRGRRPDFNAADRCRSLSHALRRLSETADTGDPDGLQRPTLAAYDLAWQGVARAYGDVDGLPELEAAPTGDGGLYLQWTLGAREVSALIHPTGDPARVYHCTPDGDGVEPFDRLSERLRWLAS